MGKKKLLFRAGGITYDWSNPMIITYEGTDDTSKITTVNTGELLHWFFIKNGVKSDVIESNTFNEDFSDSVGEVFIQAANMIGVEEVNCGSIAGVTSIDVSNIPLLNKLSIVSHKLTEIDLSNNTLLTYFSAYSGTLVNVDFTNNPLITYMSLEGNETLKTCILGNKEFLTYISLKNCDKLPSIDLSTCVNISTLEFTGCSVINPTGLEFCDKLTSITFTNCKQITGFNYPNMVDLEFVKAISATNFGLTCDFSANQKLNRVELASTGLTNLDCISTNIALTYVSVYANQGLVDVDFSNQPNATYIAVQISYNLESINVRNNPLLVDLLCSGESRDDYSRNKLTSLDITQNPLLDYLTIFSTLLTEIDLSNNPKMKSIQTYNSLFSAEANDDVLITLDGFGLTGGYIKMDDNRTSASDLAYNNLISKNWNIIFFTPL